MNTFERYDNSVVKDDLYLGYERFDSAVKDDLYLGSERFDSAVKDDLYT